MENDGDGEVCCKVIMIKVGSLLRELRLTCRHPPNAVSVVAPSGCVGT